MEKKDVIEVYMLVVMLILFSIANVYGNYNLFISFSHAESFIRAMIKYDIGVIVIVGSFITGCLFIIASLGVLMFQSWARKTVIYLSFANILLQGMLFYNSIIHRATLIEMRYRIQNGFNIFFVISFFIFIIIYLTRPRIKDQFQ